MMEQFKQYRNILCIDIKSFFASVECVALNEDPSTYNLVVADISRGKSSIVLAVSANLRKLGVPGRCRLFELPKNIKYKIVKPRMACYIEASNNILKLYSQYFSLNDILVYSIDEVFIDVTAYLKLYNTNVDEIAEMLLRKIKEELGLTAVCGIGYNMLLAKYALDIEAKKNPNNIAVWTYDSLKDKLWPITKLTSVWGIGKGNEKRLHKLGIKTMYDLAHFDIYKLVEEFGILGEELYLHAHGIDISRIQDKDKIVKKRKGYSMSHTLYKETPKNQCYDIINSLIESLSIRLRQDKKMCRVISLYVKYGNSTGLNSFQKQHKLLQATNKERETRKIIYQIFNDDVINDKIRKIGIAYSDLIDDNEHQLSLFDKREEVKLDFAYDKVNNKMGKNTIYKASALLEESQYFSRKKLIGGHNAK